MDQPASFTPQTIDQNNSLYEPGTNALTSYSLQPGQFLAKESQPVAKTDETAARAVRLSPFVSNLLVLVILSYAGLIGYLFYSAFSHAPKPVIRQPAPPAIKQGESTTLSWSIKNADSTTITAPSSRTYKLTATGPGAPPTTVAVTVEEGEGAAAAAPFITSFTAGPASTVTGRPVMLVWQTLAGSQALLKDDATGEIVPVPQTGSMQVYPKTSRTYTLSAQKGSAVLSRTLHVRVKR